MPVDSFEDIEAQLAALHAGEAPGPRKSEAARRREVEHRATEQPMDGRRARYIGRSVNISTRLKPEVHDALHAASKEYEAPIAYIVEHGIQMWIAAQKRKRAQ